MKTNDLIEELGRWMLALVMLAMLIAWLLGGACIGYPDRLTTQYHDGWRGDEKISVGLEFPIRYGSTGPEPREYVPEPEPAQQAEAEAWADPAWVVAITGLITGVLGVIYRKEVAAGARSVKKTLVGSGDTAPRP